MEIGVMECFKKKLVISRLTWGGHVEIMGDEKVAEGRYLEFRKWRGKGGNKG